MGATACLLWLFGAAGIACTYLFSFAFLVRNFPSLIRLQECMLGCQMLRPLTPISNLWEHDPSEQRRFVWMFVALECASSDYLRPW